ncbi:ADP-ribosylation factor GTPase activating protein [Trypanosoma rangeli]|uniref:ADP-ribosylation factor GTPase activating protein n=1 Tax=Trypanosoma rangeli TaxID=5698 RepID=A0A422NYW8_TRYRA|nr:ADP-ribosylation factor GTPase activating protein [Trypanosoma rangeli]RNF10693.1 ADP-ribosylation factor GTPase activating protein [Trypanosoma rangeli]|eukprot:RNF10693.1 ADP-ribosylation factor GTPase activating protein [Trypanosoma rangeli]
MPGQPCAAVTSNNAINQKLRLEKLFQLPENRECFECLAKQPRWASTNLGIFLCLRCAGVHRAMGTHVSKVRSTTMDTWEEPILQFCECVGNARGRILYEHNMNSHVRPTCTSDASLVERFIRDKYERKLYYNPQYKTLLQQFLASGESEEEWSGFVASQQVERAVATPSPPKTEGTAALMPMLWGGSISTTVLAPTSPIGSRNTKGGIDINSLFSTTTTTAITSENSNNNNNYTMQHPHQQQHIYLTHAVGKGIVSNQYHQQQHQHSLPVSSQADHQATEADAKTEIMSLFSRSSNVPPTHVYSAWQPQQPSFGCGLSQ